MTCFGQAKMAREKYDQNTIKSILNFLRHNYAEIMIISELKNKKINIRKGQICKIKKKYFVVEETKEKKGKKREKKKITKEPKSKINGKKIKNLKRIVNKIIIIATDSIILKTNTMSSKTVPMI